MDHDKIAPLPNAHTQTTFQYVHPLKQLNTVQDFKELWEMMKNQNFKDRFMNTTRSLMHYLNAKHPGLLEKHINHFNNPDLRSMIQTIMTSSTHLAISKVINPTFMNRKPSILKLCNLPRYVLAQKQLTEAIINSFNLLCVQESVVSGFSYVSPQNAETSTKTGFEFDAVSYKMSVEEEEDVQQQQHQQQQQQENIVVEEDLSKGQVTMQGSKGFYESFLLSAPPNNLLSPVLSSPFLNTLSTFIRIPPHIKQAGTRYLSIPLYRALCDKSSPTYDIPPILQFAARQKACRIMANSKIKTHSRIRNQSMETQLKDLNSPIKDPNMSVLFTQVDSYVTYLGCTNELNLASQRPSLGTPELSISYQRIYADMKGGPLIGSDKNVLQFKESQINKTMHCSYSLLSTYQEPLEKSGMLIDDFFHQNGHYAIDPTIFVKRTSDYDRFRAKTVIRFLHGQPEYLSGFLLASTFQTSIMLNYSEMLDNLKNEVLLANNQRSNDHVDALRLLLPAEDYHQFINTLPPLPSQ
ncbi:MAG: hypothetical protein EOO99_11800 [Pedobacter sp.]|nr:MAG: hypothetical protein EOO99_11800 [Pedobacter sp.]